MAIRPGRGRSDDADAWTGKPHLCLYRQVKPEMEVVDTRPGPPIAGAAREATEAGHETRVITVPMIAAVRADDLIHVGVVAASKRPPCNDADRLGARTPYCRAGLTGGRGVSRRPEAR